MVPHSPSSTDGQVRYCQTMPHSHLVLVSSELTTIATQHGDDRGRDPAGGVARTVDAGFVVDDDDVRQTTGSTSSLLRKAVDTGLSGVRGGSTTAGRWAPDRATSRTPAGRSPRGRGSCRTAASSRWPRTARRPPAVAVRWSGTGARSRRRPRGPRAPREPDGPAPDDGARSWSRSACTRRSGPSGGRPRRACRGG